MSSMPHHNDVLYLVVQYLQVKGLFASSLALQQESGLDVTWLRGCSREVALLRRWVFAGDVKRARALLQPLQNLSNAPEELEAALLALDELEMLMMKTRSEDNYRKRPLLAKAKLKCFEILVPLFRAPVDVNDSDVFKYVAMPKLQLAGLLHDAVLFHRQTGDNAARDCISVTCSGTPEDAAAKEQEGSELLLLDEPCDAEPVGEYELVLAEINSVARSVEWTNWRRRQRNPMALSMNLSKCQWLEDIRDEEEFGGEADEDERSSIPDVKETADVAVSCELDVKETADVAVSCGLYVKNTADAAVSCAPEERETTDVAVSCGPDEWSDVAPQTETENLQHFAESEEGCSTKDINCDEGTEENQRCEPESNNFSFAEDVVKDQIESDVSHHPAPMEEQSNQHQTIQLTNSTSSKDFTTSCARKSSGSLAMDLISTPVAHLKVGHPKQKVMSIENAPAPEEDDPEELHQELVNETKIDAELALLRGPPQHYDELTLDHVVCASVIAEVKEPQAVRALDVQPDGTQLAVGTNARALRVFDLSTPLQQRQEELSWSSPLNLILPLLPVAHERHKHHDSGIYCVSYNRYLFHQACAASMIASGAADGSVKVLVTRDKVPLQSQQTDEFWIQRGDVSGSMGKTRALEFASPHLLWVASTNDRRLRCWDVRRTHRSSSSGTVQTLDGHVGEIQAIAMPHSSASGPASTLLLSAALDKTVRLWDTRSRRCERLVASGVHAAFSLHFHPTDEKLVVSGHQDGSVSLWDLRSTAREALQVVVPHQDECRSVRWSPGGQWLLSAAFDGTLCVMQATNSTLQPVASYHKHYGKVLQAQWHPTEPAFVSSGADKRVKLWSFA